MQQSLAKSDMAFGSIIQQFIDEASPRRNRWHDTRVELPKIPEGELSVRVVALYRGSIVTGCFTYPKGYGYGTFVFGHVLLREAIQDVESWAYANDIMADIQSARGEF